MKHLWFISVFCFVTVSSQNIPTPVVYLIDNQYILSSAWAGIGKTFKFRAISVSRWTEVENAPSTLIASISGRIIGRSGIGAIFEGDVNGFTTIYSVTGSYAYHLSINDDNDEFLSFGMSVRYSSFNIDTSQFINAQNDPVVGGNRNENEVNFDAGVLYRRKYFFINLNVSDIINRENNFSEFEPLSIPILSLYSGYIFKQKHNWAITPSFRFQNFYADKRSELDLNLKFQKGRYEMNYWGATVLKLQTDKEIRGLSFTPMAGLKYRKLYVSYGYEMALNTLDTGLYFNRHMFSVGIDFINLNKEHKCVQ